MVHKVSWTQGRVTVHYSEYCTEAEVLTVVVDLQSDPRFDGTHQALHDFSQCESLSASPEHLEELAGRNSAAVVSNPTLRIAVVTDRADVLAMLERFESIELNPFPLRMFSNTEDANAWLNKTPSRI